ERWSRLLEDFDPVAAHRGFDIGEAGDIAARTRKARNDAVPDRIGHRGEYDRYAAGCLQHSDRRRSTVDENRFGCGCHKLHGEGADAVGVRAGPAVVDANIVTLAPAALRQPLPQCRHAAPRLRIGLSGATNHRIRSGCCARAASSAAAAPPSSAMKSRRLIRLPRRRWRAERYPQIFGWRHDPRAYLFSYTLDRTSPLPRSSQEVRIP